MDRLILQIIVEGGCVIDVVGLPNDWDYVIEDWDVKGIDETWKPVQVESNEKTIKIVVEGGCVADVQNIPGDWDYVIEDGDI